MLLKSLLFKQVFNYLNFGLQVGNGILALLFYDFSIFSMLYFSFYSFLIRFSISGKPPWALPATTSIQPSPAYQPSDMHTAHSCNKPSVTLRKITGPLHYPGLWLIHPWLFIKHPSTMMHTSINKYPLPPFVFQVKKNIYKQKKTSEPR